MSVQKDKKGIISSPLKHGSISVEERDLKQKPDNNDQARLQNQKRVNIKNFMSKMIQKEKYMGRSNLTQDLNSPHECQRCDCSGTTQCGKKIAFLQGRIRQFLDLPYHKTINEIYDIQKMGIQNEHYLVEYSDNSLEKLSTNYIKKHHLNSYVSFLQRVCFKQ